MHSFAEILLCISTHILTKRMTSAFVHVCKTCSYFNSHPHEEDDLLFRQFRLSYLYFNSHPHEEDDFVSSDFPHALSISTHILTKRMTDITCNCNNRYRISTHILTKRMTKSPTSIPTPVIFQLTSSRRG